MGLEQSCSEITLEAQAQDQLETKAGQGEQRTVLPPPYT